LIEILLIDNYDSFVYNLAQYIGELGASVIVERNDSPKLEEHMGSIDGYIISPGPEHPRNANLSLDVIRNKGFGAPVMGVCLGHQAIAHVMGARIGKARTVVHGKVAPILHQGKGILEDIPSPMMATRYHSLIVEGVQLPEEIEVIATTDDREIMAIRIREEEMYGLQFHPESVMTAQGRQILMNFLRRCSQ
jgi:anthranilate synthase/aminodeoxychorismate synthase-like glutamine amidotransferase